MNRLRKSAILLGLLLAAAPAAHASDGRPTAGTVIGRIVIPRIHLSMPVVEGQNDVSEDGIYPTHYRSTDWTCEGETVAISAHHFTHHSGWETGSGGPFRYIDELRPGDVIKLTMGGCSTRYRVTGQRWFKCGSDPFGCPAAAAGFTHVEQDKLILTTCIGNGSERRFLYAFPIRNKP